MSEAKDPAIKLFGKTIQLPEAPAAAANSECGGYASALSEDISASADDSLVQYRPSSQNSLPEDSSLDGSRAEEASEKDLPGGKRDDSKIEDGSKSMMSEEFIDPTSSSVAKESSKAPSADAEAALAKVSKAEDEDNETNTNSQDKTLKKPDKILPCPRCNSMDTKFCYYNNYNVDQPRHFCKNCQRYWTSGGSMRNVPVGSGRRKNKNLVSQYRHITVSETIHNSRRDLTNEIHHPTSKADNTILAFGSDSPLCESMASVLSIADKTMQNCTRNGFRRPEELRLPGNGNNGDEHLSGSSIIASSSRDEAIKDGLPDNNQMPKCQSISPHVPCFPGAPWPYPPWNSVPWGSAVPPAAFCPASFGMQFYPAAPYWSCTVPTTWNVPWLNSPPTNQNLNSPTSGANSPTLGKHSRDDDIMKSIKGEEAQNESNPEKFLWVPKTLRIDDPEGAARSSIWATLGIKNDKVDSVGGGGLFKAFQSKGDEKSVVSETSTVLQANPAALSRSLSFHETS